MPARDSIGVGIRSSRCGHDAANCRGAGGSRHSVVINTSIDEFVREALAANVWLDVANHAHGQHGFDVLDDDQRSREIIAGAMAFAKTRLRV